MLLFALYCYSCYWLGCGLFLFACLGGFVICVTWVGSFGGLFGVWWLGCLYVLCLRIFGCVV